MATYKQLANSIQFSIEDDVVRVVSHDPTLTHIGSGRSAAVFQLENKSLALKVFYPTFSHLASEEADIYNMLEGIPYYPSLADYGTNYIVMDYIEGKTFFQCLSAGIHVPIEAIQSVDDALELAKERGLNPSDIHLRNIILTSEYEVKIIDVARFRQKKECTQWHDLKTAYFNFYSKPFFPKRLSEQNLNRIAKLYKNKLIPVPHKIRYKKAK
ncbi:protein kinase family protein [Radiobacillus kanasensis]|uniref:protein kinase family protein n=1 Tax=Radiobacillus kanasensis TaxID=2844358 RepID=UPI001E41ECBB|nr:protein kinase family protein [Radiobacillus kanasensis]UFT98481.1 protein kinase family protein [Radiobacillus kanasensis]